MEKTLWPAIPAFVIAWFAMGCRSAPAGTCAADADAPSFVDGSPAERDAAIGFDGGAAGPDAGLEVRDAATPGDAGIERVDAGRAGPDAGPPRCIGSYAEGVAIFSAREPIVLRAHADPAETAEVTAWPWQTSFGTVRPVALDVTWRTEGDHVFVAEPVTDPRERRLLLAVTGDAFDMGVGREPALTVRACVANACPATAADGSPCRCEPDVCSATMIAYAVPRLDGRWTFGEDGADVGTFDVAQSGRELLGGPFDFPLDIDGVGVRGGELGVLVEGAITADRQSISGLRLTEDGDVIGPWTARRVD